MAGIKQTIKGNVIVTKIHKVHFSTASYRTYNSLRVVTIATMVVKSTTLLILFFKIVLLEVKPECTLDTTKPPICSSSSIITVTKTSTNYSVLVNASLCHNGYCIPDYLGNICQFCKSLHNIISGNNEFCAHHTNCTSLP